MLRLSFATYGRHDVNLKEEQERHNPPAILRMTVTSVVQSRAHSLCSHFGACNIVLNVATGASVDLLFDSTL